MYASKLALLSALLLTAPFYSCQSQPKKRLPPAEKWQDPGATPGQIVGAPARAGGSVQGAGTVANPHGTAPVANPHGTAPPVANPRGPAQAANPHASAGPGGAEILRGTIILSPSLQDEASATSVVYITARRKDPDSGQGAGTAIAVARVETSTFPVAFSLSEGEFMVPAAGLTQEIVVTARTDQDGDAISRQPGDLQGSATTTVPATDLAIVLDTKL